MKKCQSCKVESDISAEGSGWVHMGLVYYQLKEGSIEMWLCAHCVEKGTLLAVKHDRVSMLGAYVGKGRLFEPDTMVKEGES